jgi:hypothetical protein
VRLDHLLSGKYQSATLMLERLLAGAQTRSVVEVKIAFDFLHPHLSAVKHTTVSESVSLVSVKMALVV